MKYILACLGVNILNLTEDFPICFALGLMSRRSDLLM